MILTREELDYLVRFIDVTAQRGGIRGDELSSVGMIRERLVKVIELMTTEVTKLPEGQPLPPIEEEKPKPSRKRSTE